MNWKRAAIGAAFGGAIFGGALYIGWAGIDALMHLSELQLVELSAVAVGSGTLGIRHLKGKGK